MKRIVRLVRGSGHGHLDARRVASWLAAAVVFGMVMTLLAGAAVRGDGACGASCHSMRPYGAAAGKSVHASLKCVECHGSDSMAGFLADGVAIERRMTATVFGREPGVAESADEACRDCHIAELSSPMASRGIAVRHSDFKDEPCGSCHAGIAHALTGRTYDAPQMDDCMSCHSASGREPEGCAICHVPGDDTESQKKTTVWRITHGPKWKTTHGMGELSGCINCHLPKYCAGCHGVALPHPSGWQRAHGRGVGERVLTECTKCHTAGWCTDCHGVEMPHADAFIETHGDVANDVSEASCVRCHPKATCDECHFRSSHPDVPGVGTSHSGGAGR